MVLHQFLDVDQVNVYAVADIELVLRKLYGIESAVKRNPRAPQFGGLKDLFIDVPGFSLWYSGIRRDRAQVVEQEWSWAEDTGHLSTHVGGGSSSAGGGGNPNAARGETQANSKAGPKPGAAGDE
jgi:hypothetical protein